MREAADYAQEIKTNGYAIVRGALDACEIGRLRRSTAEFLATGPDHAIYAGGPSKMQVFRAEPDAIFFDLLAHPKITPILKHLSADPIRFLHEIGVGVNTVAPWHKDTHGLQRYSRTEHADYGVYKVLIYPQDHFGRTENDYALKVRRGSHWMASLDEGEEETLYIRAGDVIIFDVRTTHRGQPDPVEFAGKLGRAMYYPLRHYFPDTTYKAVDAFRRAFQLTDRHLVTLLYGTKNAFSEEYFHQGRAVAKARRPNTIIDDPLPSHWAERLTAAGLEY